MKCSPFDLRDYFLKELPTPQAAQVEEHIQSCSECREEFDRLRLTEVALFTLRDEEIPQRIAFVSDKIFEPSLVRRWFSAFWGSSGRLGFASAAILSTAIVFSSVNKNPAPAPVPDRAAIQPIVAPGPSAEEIQARIDKAVAAAVDKAVTESRETTRLIADLRHENELANAQLVRVAGDLESARMRDQRKKRDEMALAQPSDSGDPK